MKFSVVARDENGNEVTFKLDDNHELDQSITFDDIARYKFEATLNTSDTFLLTDMPSYNWVHFKMVNGTSTQTGLIEKDQFNDGESIQVIIQASPEITGTLANSGGTITFTSSDSGSTCRVNEIKMLEVV